MVHVPAASPLVVGLVACGKLKRAVPSPARSLYLGALVTKSLAHAARVCNRVFIISAWHGLLDLDTMVDPYNLKLTDLPKLKRAQWGRYVASQLIAKFAHDPLYLVTYASTEYAKHIQNARGGAPWSFHPPLAGWEGMPIGRRLQALNDAALAP